MNNFKKKFISIALILTFSFVFTACGTETSENLGESTVNRTYQGELSFLTASFGGLDISHLLITEARERVYLRSITQDLDKYVNLNVRVSGPFFTEDVSGKKVNVLQVEKIDILSEEVALDEIEYVEAVLENENLGLKFSYNSSLFEEQSNDNTVILNGKSGTDVLSVKSFKETDALNMTSYIDLNYSDITFVEEQLSNGLQALSNYPGQGGNLIYLIKDDGYFYKFSLVNTDDKTFQSYAEELKALVNSLVVLDKKLDEEESVDAENSESDLDDTSDESVVYPSFSSIDIAKQEVINNFQKQAKTLGLDNEFRDIESYAFADDNYFYVIYGLEENRSRALISYSGNDTFKVVAQFIPGAVTDWERVSGENLAANSQLTLIMVGSDSASARELDIQKGYRYLESVQRGFGMQYPQQWYYAGNNKSYVFSDKPIGESETLVEVLELDEEFSSLSGDTITSNIKKKVSGDNVSYYVALEEGKVLEVKGAAEFDSKMNVMANSILSL